jgi:hypothetical protein
MTIEERKLNIALQLSNNANSILVAQLAATMAEAEELKSKLAELSPKPSS